MHSAGYYYDSGSGYYYDANTGLYFNSESQQWLALDPGTGQFYDAAQHATDPGIDAAAEGATLGSSQPPFL